VRRRNNLPAGCGQFCEGPCLPGDEWWNTVWLTRVSPVDRPGFPGQNEGMSVVEDIRQALQDFLAPELRAVAAKFESIESKIDAVNIRISSLEKAVDSRFSAAEEKANIRQEAMDARLSAAEEKANVRQEAMDARFSAAEEKANVRQEMILVQFERITNLLDVDKRLLRLESQREEPLAKSA
jgi:hypothetical protein